MCDSNFRPRGVAFSAWVLVIFWACAGVGRAQSSISPYKKLEVFARALAHIEQAYVSPVDEDQLIYGALRGMLQALDPHSAFLDPNAYRILTSDTVGRYAGVGVEVDVQDGWLTVLTAFKGGPAARAGLQPGDRFLTIAGYAARDMPIAEAIERMRGEPGTKVAVSLRRPGQDDAIAVELTRENLTMEAVEAKAFGDGVIWIHVQAFQEDTAREFRAALTRGLAHLRQQGVPFSGLLLDLRDNPGGLVSAAALIADEFLDQGVIVSTRSRDGRSEHVHRAHAPGTRSGFPIVLLVNRFSASASEIVAGALQDHGRAVVVGTRTFGKGSVQNVIELPDGSAIKLTTALYYTPAGRSIQATGIVPDVEVPQVDERTRQALHKAQAELSEASLEGHLSSGYGGPAKGDHAGQVAVPFANDYQAMVGYQVLQALVASQRKAVR